MARWNKIIASMLIMCFLMTQVFAQIPEQPYACVRETLATHSRPGKINDMFKDQVNGYKPAGNQNEPASDESEPTPGPADVNDAPLPADDSIESDNKIIRQFNLGMVQAVAYVATVLLWIKFLMPVMRQYKYDILNDGIRENLWQLAYVRFNDHALDFYTPAGILGAALLYGAFCLMLVAAGRYIINNVIGFGKRFTRSALARYISIGGAIMRWTWPLLAAAAIYYFEVAEPLWFADEGASFNGTTASFWDGVALFAGFAVFTYAFVRLVFKEAWKKDGSSLQLIKDEWASMVKDVTDMLNPGRSAFDDDSLLGARLDGEKPTSAAVATEKMPEQSAVDIDEDAGKDDIEFTISRRVNDEEFITIIKGGYTPSNFHERKSLEHDARALIAA